MGFFFAQLPTSQAHSRLPGTNPHSNLGGGGGGEKAGFPALGLPGSHPQRPRPQDLTASFPALQISS
jgi:hypothetical protein